jgi:hypothetical protein
MARRRIIMTKVFGGGETLELGVQRLNNLTGDGDVCRLDWWA